MTLKGTYTLGKMLRRAEISTSLNRRRGWTLHESAILHQPEHFTNLYFLSAPMRRCVLTIPGFSVRVSRMGLVEIEIQEGDTMSHRPSAKSTRHKLTRAITKMMCLECYATKMPRVLLMCQTSDCGYAICHSCFIRITAHSESVQVAITIPS